MAYAESTFLPLRRRAAKTLRPFFVLIRLRNPWSFLRLRLFGLNDGFISIHLRPQKPLPTHYKEIRLKSQERLEIRDLGKYPQRDISQACGYPIIHISIFRQDYLQLVHKILGCEYV